MVSHLKRYRQLPVSILPILYKGLEKVILARVVEFSEKHCLFKPSQFGFRQHRSTELPLLEQKKFILEKLEEKKLELRIFVDFRKAFDYLTH